MASLSGVTVLLVVLLAVSLEAKPRYKKLHARLFRDDWTAGGEQELPAHYSREKLDDVKWRQWSDDRDINLGEEKVKDMLNDVKQDIPKFDDPCKSVFCHYGRVCVSTPEGEANCQCAGADFCIGHSKKVCGTDGVWYPSHCELHRMACVKGIHIGINHSGKDCTAQHSPDDLLEPVKNPKATEKKQAEKEQKEQKEKEQEQKKEPEKEEVTTEREEKEEKEEITERTSTTPPPCTELEFERLKANLLKYHCARIGENCSDKPARKQFLANIMFSYYDHDSDQQLSEGELSAIEHQDHLDRLSRFCSLVDMLTFDDRQEDGNISLTEFYKAFKIPSVVLDENLLTFTTSVATGNSIELKCDIKGAEEIVWKRNGGSLDDITTDDIKVFEDGSLYISNLGLHHMGNYTCQDKYIDNVVQTHALKVQLPPRVQVSPTTQFHTTGSSVTLRCHADGVPEPEIIWEMNEAPLTDDIDNRHYLLLHNNATLEIKTATYTKDTGAYKCKARNSAGSAQDIATVFIENAKVPKYSEGTALSSAFVVFHDKGYTMYEPDHCHIEHQIPAAFSAFQRLPEPATGATTPSLCEPRTPCSWGEAVNVRDKFIYISQPKMNRVVVIELRDRANPVEIIPTDKFPVSLHYVEHLDQVWVLCWNEAQAGGSKTVVVIRQASEDQQHHTVHTQPIGNRFDLVSDVFLPPHNDLGQRLEYGYVVHSGQRALYKLDLHAMKYAKTIDLADFDCLPSSLAFLPLGGQVMVHCHSSGSGAARRSSRLVLDYVTDKVLEYTDLGGEPLVSPDGRFMVVVDRQDNTLAVYRIHDNGKLEHLFDEYTNIHVSDVTFFPSERGRSYDFYASSVDKNDVLYINLGSGNVEMIEGVGQSILPEEWPWSSKNRKIVAGGLFADFLITPSRDSVVVIDGKRRHVQCEWQDIAHGNVMVWVQPQRL